MATILPFQGIRYNTKRIRDLSAVVSPPYDVISKKEQERYYHTSPYNVIRLELGKTFSGDNGVQNRYRRAKTFFERWFSEGVLVQDEEPSIYIYEHRFRKGKRLGCRLGFVALLKLEGSKQSVYPHEKTFPSPKEDRFLLLQQLGANVSPLFFLFSDRKKEVTALMKRAISRTSLIVDISCGTERHKVWRLTDPSVIRRLRASIAQQPLFIADGHHRYEVARTFQKKMKGKRGNCVMAYFSNLLDLDLTILPIHRVVKNLGGNFDALQKKLSRFFTFKVAPSASALLEAMEKKKGSYVFGMYWKGKPFYLLTLKSQKALSEIDGTVRRSKAWRRLDVTILHALVLKKGLGLSERSLRQSVLYSREVSQCLKEVRTGGYQAAFFLRGARIEQIAQIARSREKVPQKSTYFYPKPLTGLVMYRLREEKTHV